MSNTLFLDSHAGKTFKVLYKNKIYYGEDVAISIASIFETCNNLAKIEKIIVLKGPGSFTSLRIGVTFAIAYSLAKNIKILGLKLFDLFLNAYPNYNIYFYTGTKKWLKFCKSTTRIIEKNSKHFNEKKPWISNEPEKLEIKNGISYPEILFLMEKYEHLASSNLNLLYPITMFS